MQALAAAREPHEAMRGQVRKQDSKQRSIGDIAVTRAAVEQGAAKLARNSRRRSSQKPEHEKPEDEPPPLKLQWSCKFLQRVLSRSRNVGAEEALRKPSYDQRESSCELGCARAAPRLSERYDTSSSMAQCSGTVAKQYFPHRPPPSADEAMLSESSGA